MTIWAPQLADRRGPRYLAIADALAEDVEAERLAAGTRLPTHRDLADRLGVTVGTVSRAYAEAARRGLLSGEVGRGTFVRQPRSAFALPATLDARPADLVDLSQNHPPMGGPETEEALRRTLAALATQAEVSSLLGYPLEGGSAPHREAGVAWLARVGLEARADQVVICSGSQHALTTVLSSILKPGELLLTEALTYPGLKAAASLLHLRLQGLPMDAEGLRADAFEAACSAGAARGLYVVPTIHNPTTTLMTDARRKEIADIAVRHRVPILEDDIHALLPEERPQPIAAWAPAGTYYVTSTSKVLAPGLRIAYVLAPEGRAEALAAATRATTWGVSPVMAEMTSAWIQDGTADLILRARRREASARQLVARRVLAGLDFKAHPFGYHLWLTLPEPWRSDSFAAQARRRGVLVSPAETFVVGRGSSPHAVRVSLGSARSRGELERGLRALAALLQDAPDAGPTV